MLSQIKTQNILFLDIETVPGKENFENLDTTFQTLWAEKTLGSKSFRYFGVLEITNTIHQ